MACFCSLELDNHIFFPASHCLPIGCVVKFHSVHKTSFQRAYRLNRNKRQNYQPRAGMGHLEVACFNTESALLAAAEFVERIELCVDRRSGGVTPPLALLKDLRSRIPQNTRIHVMIRPRGGNFTYDDAELEIMCYSIEQMKFCCNGFVLGILKEDRTVDINACSKLVKLAEPLPCTFHRAFDETPDLLKALEDVVSCGFKTILTSGGPGNAVENIPVLSQLLKAAENMPPASTDSDSNSTKSLAQKSKVVIMPGGGLRGKEIGVLQDNHVRPEWFHTSAIADDGETADKSELRIAKLVAQSHANVMRTVGGF